MQKILVVEDEKAMARAMQLKLQHSGFEADIAKNGIEALEMMKKNSYSLVLLDLMLPQKDGFSVLEELKENKNKVPIIVSTNLSQEEDMERAKELGAIDYFVKANISIADLVGKVKNALKL